MNPTPTLLHHTETGPPEAPALVLLHGFMGSSADWRNTLEPLAERFRCIALDLPGHGRSLGLPAETYTWEGTLAAITATLDALSLDRFGLVGYSMGGRLALGLALDAPCRPSRIVLVGTSSGLSTDTARADRQRLDEQRARAIEADLPAFLEEWYRMPLFEALDARPALRDDMIARRSRNDPVELARGLRGLSPSRMPDYWDRLDHLGAPTLAVAGARDPKFVDLAHRMAVRGRPIRTVILPDAGHSLLTERPALLADTIAGFCTSAPVTASRDLSPP